MTLFICIWLVVLTAIILLFWHDTMADIKDIKEYAHNIWGVLPSRYYYDDIRSAMRDRFDKLEINLATEIACLATKNNEDIKRMKGFQVGDVIEYGGEETLVLDRQMMTLNNKENLTDYIIWNKTQGMQQETASHLEHNAKFLRRVSLKE